MKRDAGLCQPSLRHGLVVQATAVDHVRSKAHGGTDDDGNLQAISDAPHAAKTAAERGGGVWDERAWFAAQGRGGQISGAACSGTERKVKFLRAQVSEKFWLAEGEA